MTNIFILMRKLSSVLLWNQGARNGPSLMPGGTKKAYALMEDILTKCAAQVNDEACTGYIGKLGSGNYVKMVHNGIEYGTSVHRMRL